METLHVPHMRSRIVLVGCGGTGGYLVPDLARFIYSLKDERVSKFVLADGDRVEERNLLRQNFIPPDFGRNKAEVLAERYGRAFGINIGCYPGYIESVETLDELFYTDDFSALDILIGAVDNNRTRQLFHEYFYRHPGHLVYIDSGNALHDGQVAVGVRNWGSTIIPPIGRWFPDILEDSDARFPSEVPCGEAVVSEPQTMIANRFAAALIMGILAPLLEEKHLYCYLSTFDTRLLAAKGRKVHSDLAAEDGSACKKEAALK